MLLFQGFHVQCLYQAVPGVGRILFQVLRGRHKGRINAQQLRCPDEDIRGWYYALLDYGAYLKSVLPNPSRRSKSHVRQSRFVGSHRQKRGELVRMLLAARETGLALDDAVQGLGAFEQQANRPPVSREDVLGLLGELEQEGFCRAADGVWTM